MRRKTSKLWCYLAVLVLAFACFSTEARSDDIGEKKDPSPPRGQRIFYASHSLMWYVPTPLGEMAQAAGIEGHQLVGLQSLGASRTLQHWELPDPQNQAKQALNTGAVDVLVMSPIQLPDEGVENFVKLALAHNPKMRFVMQISWGGGDTDNQDFPKGAWAIVDHNKTPEQLKKLYARNIQAGEAQADAINKKYGQGRKILALVPSAQAMVVLRTMIFNRQIPGLNSQNELFADAVHPTAPMQTLNTYLHFAVVYGRSPIGLPMPTVLKNVKRDDWNEKFNRTLQEIAWKTVSNYPYSGVRANESPGSEAGLRHDAAVGKAGAEYRRALMVADKQFLADLDRARKSAERAGDADEIVRIDARKTDVATRAALGASSFTLWEIRGPDRSHKIWMMSDGAAVNDQMVQGKWQKNDKEITFAWPQEHDSVTLDDAGRPAAARNVDTGDSLTAEIIGTDMTGAPLPRK